MSQHQAFRRTAVPAQVAQQLQTITLPAPTRGIMQSENEAYMQPGAAVVCDNWKPTMKGVSLRGGFDRWCVLPDAVPIISGFQYASANIQRMFAGQATKLYDVTTAMPAAVKTGQTSGNYASTQLANAAGDWLIVVNDAGDPPLRYDGTSWETLDAAYTPPAGKPSKIDVDLVKYPGAKVDNGANLVYVCKYRNRLFFIEKNSMNAWYLGIDAVGGNLDMVPLSGAATKGGKLLFCARWSLDAGDGTDDKLVFCTDLGEILVFTGSDPSVATNWRQEGRYELSPPLGMNAHLSIGGDLLVATVDGILPTSGAITKDRAELEMAAVTRNIKIMWREEMLGKRAQAWSMCKWDEYGGIFVALPGDPPGKQKCLVVNAATGAWARFTGWDCTCFMRMRGDMFFGTQKGIVMQADKTGKDDGALYVATLVGGWEVFQSPSQTVTWRQARAAFSARAREPFQPQLAACTNFIVTVPPPPDAGLDPGPLDVWDQGLWDHAKWDAPPPPNPVVRNTGWVSIGETGFSHAPILQVTVSQISKPLVDLISIAATFERGGVNV
jgi:hypothetical protein